MKIGLFREVVKVKKYVTEALPGSPKNDAGWVSNYKWESTNKLLGVQEGLLGCKTGITSAAGPCFAGYYEMGDTKLAIVLCHSRS